MQCTKPFFLGNDLNGMTLPCGKCIACKIARSREWATRMLHESFYHKDKVFLTLTYDDEHLLKLKNYSINKNVLQKFMRRIRKKYKHKKFKYLACGEYGDPKKTWRPHYHIILLGLGIDDDFEKIILPDTKRTIVYNHPSWKYGYIHIGSVTYFSCRYMVKYIYEMKNYGLLPMMENPFMLCSKGIGKQFVIDNEKKLLQDLSVRINGHLTGLPRYYKKILKKLHDEKNKELLTERFLQKRIDNDEKLYRVLKTKKIPETKMYEKILKERIIRAKHKQKLNEMKG